MTRRLAAILVADVVGYSRLMEADEAGTLQALKERRKTILEPVVKEHGGRIVKLMGDGVLVEFASAVNAVKAALELQEKFAAVNEGVDKSRHIVLRIGISLGDVIGEGSDIYGDGVNIAARLEGLAEPGGILVSANAHEQAKNKLEAVFEDAGQQMLKNIAEPVRAYRVITGTGQSSISRATAQLPSIAVLPFDNMSGDPGQNYFSDGITEDIITELSRFGNLSVAARHASFHLGGKGVNTMQAARELGVTYVVEGSVRKTGERIRVTVQFIDARTGNHIWAERYDREARDIFAVQDEVVSAIVATLEGRMVAASAQLARKKPTASWSAYDCMLQGRVLVNANKVWESVPFFERAITIDPNFGQAHAWLAMALVISYVQDSQSQRMSDATQVARTALALDGNDSTVHWANAMVMLRSGRHERAGAHFDRAVALNPANTEIRADRATWLRLIGRPEEALIAIDGELERGSFFPDWYWLVRGQILFDLKRYREAIDAFDNLPNKSQYDYVFAAAAHAYLGDTAKAQQELAKAEAQGLKFSLSDETLAWPYAEKRAHDHLLDGLRKAGLPE